MNRTIVLAAAILIVAVGGCNRTRQVADKAPVSGKVTLANGNPVRDVLITLQPTRDGHPGSVPVDTDGAFKLELVPGNYLFYFEAQRGKAAALKAIPGKYHSANMSHSVSVSSGAALDIKLDAN